MRHTSIKRIATGGQIENTKSLQIRGKPVYGPMLVPALSCPHQGNPLMTITTTLAPAEQKASYDERGYILHPDLLTQDELATLRAALDEVLEEALRAVREAAGSVTSRATARTWHHARAPTRRAVLADAPWRPTGGRSPAPPGPVVIHSADPEPARVSRYVLESSSWTNGVIPVTCPIRCAQPLMPVSAMPRINCFEATR